MKMSMDIWSRMAPSVWNVCGQYDRHGSGPLHFMQQLRPDINTVFPVPYTMVCGVHWWFYLSTHSANVSATRTQCTHFGRNHACTAWQPEPDDSGRLQYCRKRDQSDGKLYRSRCAGWNSVSPQLYPWGLDYRNWRPVLYFMVRFPLLGIYRLWATGRHDCGGSDHYSDAIFHPGRPFTVPDRHA